MNEEKRKMIEERIKLMCEDETYWKLYDRDKYVYLIEEAIEEKLSNDWDNFEQIEYGEETLTYKAQLITSHNGNDEIMQESTITFNKYTGEEID